MMLDFHPSPPAQVARAAYKACLEAAIWQDDADRLPGLHEYHVKDGVPDCVASLQEKGLFEPGTRNKTTMSLVLLLKAIGKTKEEALGIVEEWAENLPENMTNTGPAGRRIAARATTRWAYRRDTDGNCALMVECGASCPGQENCAFIKGKVRDEKELDAAPVTLEEANQPRFVGRKLTFKATPVAVDQRPQLVPARLALKCSPEPKSKVCKSCRYNHGRGCSNEMGPRDILKISTITNDREFDGLFRRMLRVPKSCPNGFVQIKSRKPLLLTLVQPTANGKVEAVRENKVFYQGTSLHDQDPHEFEVYTFPHPRTQEAVQVATTARPVMSRWRSYEATPEKHEALKRVQASGNVMNLQSRLAELSKFFGESVSLIYGRPIHNLMLAMPWFCPLEFRFNGKVQRAWLEVLAFGDTGQGKTEIVDRLISYLGQGTMVSGKNMSVAGMTVGLDRVDGRHIVRKGVMVQNDGGLIAVDEWGAVADEVATCMTDARSGGVVRMSKINSAELRARNRKILLANPILGKARRSCTMGDMPYGIQHVLPLMRTPEDVRRLDYVVGFEASPRIFDEIHKGRGEPYTGVYTQELLRMLCMWAWSRTSDQIQITEGALEAANAASQVFSGPDGYSKSVPLCMPGDMAPKILRVAMGLAGMTYSTEDGITMVVTADHVDCASSLLHLLYQGDELQFDLFTLSDPEHKGLEWQTFFSVCVELPKLTSIFTPMGPEMRWPNLFSVLLANPLITDRDLRAMSGVLQMDPVILCLTSHQLLVKGLGGYKLNARGTRLAKLMLKLHKQGIIPDRVEKSWFETEINQ